MQALLRQTESELGLCMLDAQRTQEDPLQRQRLLVEEERLKYLNEEELIIQQLQSVFPTTTSNTKQSSTIAQTSNLESTLVRVLGTTLLKVHDLNSVL